MGDHSEPFLRGEHGGFDTLGSTADLALNPDDLLTVELDLSGEKGTMRFMVNGRSDMFKANGVAFDDIKTDKCYKLAIGMYLRDRIELYQVL